MEFGFGGEGITTPSTGEVVEKPTPGVPGTGITPAKPLEEIPGLPEGVTGKKNDKKAELSVDFKDCAKSELMAVKLRVTGITKVKVSFVPNDSSAPVITKEVWFKIYATP